VLRLVLVALVLALGGGARGQDDDNAGLETARPDGIPERLQALEREWHEEVGTKDPTDPTEKPDADEVPELAPAEDRDHPEEAEVKPTPPEDVPPKKAPALLQSPLKAPIAGHAPSRAAAAKDAKSAAPAKPLARDATTPEE
jgi:hypothetical protein